MMVVICYAPSSVLATIFMNGKGFLYQRFFETG